MSNQWSPMTEAEFDADWTTDDTDVDYEMFDCGRTKRWQDGKRLPDICTFAGTEWCEFECPYRSRRDER